MELLFSYLFKYRPFFFQEGDFSFLWPISAWIFLLACVAGVGLLFLIHYKMRLTWQKRLALWGLKAGFLLMLLLLLMRPTLTLSLLVPQQTLLAVLADNSKSMGIDEREGPRGELVKPLLSNDSDFIQALKENFLLRTLRFDGSAESLNNTEELTWDGNQTNLSAALERVLADTKNLPLGGIVLITDGSDNSYRDISETVSQLIARNIPIHTVGVGPTQLERDLEIIQVSTPKEILPGSMTAARITLRHNGFGGATAKLNVREGSTLVESKEIVLSRDSDLTTVEVKLFSESNGVKTYDFEVTPLQDEEIVENNSRRTFVHVKDSRPRILLVEGRPRWEYKFIRQAVSDDENIRLEALLRTALNKFYRQGIKEESTLAAGFPADKETLFEYKALLVGDVESAFFTYPQMEMIRDFVALRGGGLLMLGGGSTLSNGGYANTPVEEALPVWLDQSVEQAGGRTGSGYVRNGAKVVLTDYGRNHSALQLARTADESSRFWTGLPPVTDRNLFRDLKPGATVLAEMEPEISIASQKPPLLISHRFGRGLGIVFMSGSSWRWQMLKDHEDQTHETFWKQMLRWLVSKAKDPVSVEVAREIYSQNEPIRIRAEINDSSFNRINEARVEATVFSPSGSQAVLPMKWLDREDGVYTAEWSAQEDGLHRVAITAKSTRDTEAETQFGASETFFLTLTGQAEFFDPVQKESFLRQLSEDTGGRYYSLSDAQDLPEEIVYSESESSVTEILELWNMPINFLLMIGLLFSEWILRKRWGIV